MKAFIKIAKDRNSPIPFNVWHCILKKDDKYFDCRLYYNGSAKPGYIKGVTIFFLTEEGEKNFSSGEFFEIWEDKLVGYGEIS